MLHPLHLRKLVRDVLQELGAYCGRIHWSWAAENLLCGTAAQESIALSFLWQYGPGYAPNGPGRPGKGIMQIEPSTWALIWDWVRRRSGDPEFYLAILSHFGIGENPNQAVWDLRASIVMARLLYWSIAEPLPSSDDVPGMAAYWKAHYNSAEGAGTPADFIKHYHELAG